MVNYRQGQMAEFHRHLAVTYAKRCDDFLKDANASMHIVGEDADSHGPLGASF